MNETIFYFLNNLALRSEFFDTLVIFNAVFFVWWLVGGILAWAAYRFWKYKDVLWKALAVIFVSAIGAFAIAHVLKVIIASPRPFFVLDDVRLLLLHGDTDSFPSGHATFASALATALYFYHKQLALWYFAGALLIGVSRVIAGVHWPVDILAGYALGGLVSAGVYYLYKNY